MHHSAQSNEPTRAMHQWYIENIGEADTTLMFEYEFGLTMGQALWLIDILDRTYDGQGALPLMEVGQASLAEFLEAMYRNGNHTTLVTAQ